MGIAEISIIVALILSIVLHEVAHGYAANWLGDPTARLAGRLSPNPLRHIDPLGSVIIPAFLFITQAGFLFGWAKPVPYNPYNLKAPWGLPHRMSEAIVAGAGPATNILLALIFSVFLRSADALGLSASVMELSLYIVYINILLALFNLIPVPPLDGSKILSVLLPYKMAMSYRDLMGRFEQFGLLFTFLFIFIFITVLSQPFGALVGSVVFLFTGMNL